MPALRPSEARFRPRWWREVLRTFASVFGEPDDFQADQLTGGGKELDDITLAITAKIW
jgi:hypothetical protein